MFKGALISAAQLSATHTFVANSAASAWVLLDCSFDLTDPKGGETSHVAGHIPGARYVNLDHDLAGPPHAAGAQSAAFTGRHPLPDRQDFARRVGLWGIGPHTQVVAYDNQGGMFAARTWWLLRWLGHGAVAVLDGGMAAWRAAGGAVETGSPATTQLPLSQSPYPATEHAGMGVIDAAGLLAQLGRVRLLDARSPQRWRGEGETLDPVGGHIPGSVPRFFKDNLLPNGLFKPASQLKEEFVRLGAGMPDTPVVHQCGSGVTACHNLLAMEHAGLGAGALYAGSWSEWCADPTRPQAVG
jgi:thiosulfate/3-mercaptopyruvate sulfurtransferase